MARFIFRPGRASWAMPLRGLGDLAPTAPGQTGQSGAPAARFRLALPTVTIPGGGGTEGGEAINPMPVPFSLPGQVLPAGPAGANLGIGAGDGILTGTTPTGYRTAAGDLGVGQGPSLTRQSLTMGAARSGEGAAADAGAATGPRFEFHPSGQGALIAPGTSVAGEATPASGAAAGTGPDNLALAMKAASGVKQAANVADLFSNPESALNKEIIPAFKNLFAGEEAPPGTSTAEAGAPAGAPVSSQDITQAAAQAGLPPSAAPALEKLLAEPETAKRLSDLLRSGADLSHMSLQQLLEDPAAFLAAVSPGPSEVKGLGDLAPGVAGPNVEEFPGLTVGTSPVSPDAGLTVGGVASVAGIAGSLLSALAGLVKSKELGLAGQTVGLGATLGGAASSASALAAGVELTATAGAGLAFAPVALGAAAFGLADVFNTSAQDFAKSTKELFASVPEVAQIFASGPKVFEKLNSAASADEAKRIYDELQGLQDQFQNRGVENLLKSAGRVTGENTAYNLFGGGGNFNATYPNAPELYQKLVPAGMAIDLGRLRAADFIGKATGEAYGDQGPFGFALTFGGTNPEFMKALFPAGYEAIYESEWSGGPPAGLMPLPYSPSQYVDPKLYKEIMALKPGNYEQGLANILARYGGWGAAGKNTGANDAQGYSWTPFMLPPRK